MAEPVVRMALHSVDLALPCEGCIHAEVCRIKPVLEEMKASVSLPAFESAISFAEPPVLRLSCEFRSLARKARADAGVPRKLNLTDADRERRRQQALAMSARNAARNVGGGSMKIRRLPRWPFPPMPDRWLPA